MKYFAAVRQAHPRIMSENSCRDLAERAVSSQAETGASLTQVQTDLSEIRRRVSSIETILKAVE